MSQEKLEKIVNNEAAEILREFDWPWEDSYQDFINKIKKKFITLRSLALKVGDQKLALRFQMEAGGKHPARRKSLVYVIEQELHIAGLVKKGGSDRDLPESLNFELHEATVQNKYVEELKNLIKLLKNLRKKLLSDYKNFKKDEKEKKTNMRALERLAKKIDKHISPENGIIKTSWARKLKKTSPGREKAEKPGAAGADSTKGGAPKQKVRQIAAAKELNKRRGQPLPIDKMTLNLIKQRKSEPLASSQAEEEKKQAGNQDQKAVSKQKTAKNGTKMWKGKPVPDLSGKFKTFREAFAHAKTRYPVFYWVDPKGQGRGKQKNITFFATPFKKK